MHSFAGAMFDWMVVWFDSLNPFGSVDQTNAVMKASAIEVASEVCEEEDAAHLSTNLSSPSEPPSEANSWRRRDLVSMVTFRLVTGNSKHTTTWNKL